MEKLAYTVPEAAQVANTGQTKLKAEIKAGRLRVTKIGRKSLVRHQALLDWLDRCEQEAHAGKVSA